MLLAFSNETVYEQVVKKAGRNMDCTRTVMEGAETEKNRSTTLYFP